MSYDDSGRDHDKDAGFLDILSKRCPDTMVRRRFGIHDGAFTVTATLLRDEAGNDWLMHPPCAAEMRHDILALARVVGATRLVSNPWCLTWAVLNTGVTVEAQWVAARRQAAADGGGGGYASPV